MFYPSLPTFIFNKSLSSFIFIYVFFALIKHLILTQWYLLGFGFGILNFKAFPTPNLEK